MIKKFIITLFFICNAFADVNTDKELLNVVMQYITQAKTGDTETFISILTDEQKRIVDNEDFREIQRKMLLKYPLDVGGYIFDIKNDGNEALVKIAWKSFKGHSTADYKFIKENGQWKFFTTYSKEKLNSDSYRKLKEEKIEHPCNPLSTAEHFLLLVSEWEDFRVTLQEVKKLKDVGEDVAKDVSYEEFIRGTAKNLSQIYTEDEMKQMIDFFETQVGLKYLYTNRFMNKKIIDESMKQYFMSKMKNVMKQREDQKKASEPVNK